MSDQHLLLIHWEKEEEVVDSCLHRLKNRANSKAIHDIRVAIKKLRAFLELYSLLKDKSSLNDLLVKTGRMFEILGKSRDIEICMELIPVYEKENDCRYTELTQYLKPLLKKTREWAKQSIHKYHKKELQEIATLLKEEKSFQDEELLIENIQQIIIDQLLEISAYFKQPHKVRQRLKKIYYWMLLLPESNQQKLSGVNKLHHILDDLGKWQDNEILSETARRFRKNYLPKSFEEAALLKVLEGKIESGKEKLRKSAFGKTRRLIKKIAAEFL